MLNATLSRGGTVFQQSGIQGYLIVSEANAQFAVIYEASANTLSLDGLDEIHILMAATESSNVLSSFIASQIELYDVDGVTFFFEDYAGPISLFKKEERLPGQLKMTPYVLSSEDYSFIYGPQSNYQIIS